MAITFSYVIVAKQVSTSREGRNSLKSLTARTGWMDVWRGKVQ